MRWSGNLARLGLVVIAAAIALDCVALAIDIVLGRRLVRGETVTLSDLDLSSSMSSTANLAVPLAAVLGGVAFVGWFHQAYVRRAETGPTAHEPSWAVFGWLVPGLNLVRPPQIMNELAARPSLVAGWWLAWLIGATVQLALRFISPATQQGWVNWQSTALVANLVLLISLGCALALVAAVARQARLGSRPVVAVAPGG